MRWTFPILFGSLLASGVFATPQVEPVPESNQAALALKVLENYHRDRSESSSKKLHVVYFTPSDREPQPRYRERLQGVVEDIRAFYRDGMKRAGFGPQTFELARDDAGKLIIHVVKGKLPEKEYKRSPGFGQDQEVDATSRDNILAEVRPVLQASGIDMEHETVLIFCNLARWDAKERKYSHHSPYCGWGDNRYGVCFAVDSEIINVDDLPKKDAMLHDAEFGEESIGKFNTIFIGGIAHELGHAFGLAHCGERSDERPRGVSLMGAGNHTYREELRGEGPGSFLTAGSAMRLASHPLFNHCEKDTAAEPRIEGSDVDLSTNVTRLDLATHHGVRLQGKVEGDPPVYGIIATFNSLNDWYHSPSATAVPDAQGRYAIEIGDLAPCMVGELRIEFCHVNGGVSHESSEFGIASDGTLDTSRLDIWKKVEPLANAVDAKDSAAAQNELQTIEGGNGSELCKQIASKLAATLDGKSKLSPADVPSVVTNLPLGDACALSAKVGWLEPTANRVPKSDQINSPLLDSGKLYATGLFAHAPSRYEFDLGGKWKTLHGEAGLHSTFQSFGSVVFIIKADGKEIFRSRTIRGATHANYDVSVSGVNRLELIVDDAGDRNAGDWGLWLDPMLAR